MIDRRSFLTAALLAPTLGRPAWAEAASSLADELEFPEYESIDQAVEFGFGAPSAEEKERAAAILKETDDWIAASSPRAAPVDVAQYFLDRFKDDPEVISQWPAPSAWNPLIVAFLRSTGYPANNDMIAWCAAFANWCIEHSLGKSHTSASASSQSFLKHPSFRAATTPKRGDLAVFTLFDRDSGEPVAPPLGHVAFVAEAPTASRVNVLGGNQSEKKHSSIISIKSFPTTPFPARRRIGGKYVRCTMRLNKFLTYA